MMLEKSEITSEQARKMCDERRESGEEHGIEWKLEEISEHTNKPKKENFG